MKLIDSAVLAMATLTATQTMAQTAAADYPSLGDICSAYVDHDWPDWAATGEFVDARDSDDFCALLFFPDHRHKAARQLGKAVGLVRSTLNVNRLYLDLKRHAKAFLQVAGAGVDNDNLAYHTGTVAQTISPMCQRPTIGVEVVYYADDRPQARFQVFPLDAYGLDCMADVVRKGFLIRMPLHTTSDGRPLAVEVDTPEDVIALFTSFHSAAVATDCVELSVSETTFSCAVTAEHDPSFDITLEVVVPHGYARPSEKIQRAVKAAAREWESVLTQGFPDHSDVELSLTGFAYDVIVIPHVDDLYIGYYFDPEQRGRTVASTNTWPTRLKPTKPGRPMLRSYASGIRFYPRADTLRFEWLVKLAVHEIGHAILFNSASNNYGGLWDRSRDMWIGADGVRAYRASGGEGSGVPMVNGVHWPWHFLQERTSGGDIMESSVNSHAVLGAVTRGALRDFGYAINDDVVPYQPSLPKSAGEPPVVFECEGHGGEFTTVAVKHSR